MDIKRLTLRGVIFEGTPVVVTYRCFMFRVWLNPHRLTMLNKELIVEDMTDLERFVGTLGEVKDWVREKGAMHRIVGDERQKRDRKKRSVWRFVEKE